MLQQTQVKTVIPYFVNFVSKIPNLKILSTSSEKTILKLWEGLGYYRRAKNLHKSAKILIKHVTVGKSEFSKCVLLFMKRLFLLKWLFAVLIWNLVEYFWKCLFFLSNIKILKIWSITHSILCESVLSASRTYKSCTCVEGNIFHRGEMQ